MKRILITGTNSYIGNAIYDHLLRYRDPSGDLFYEVDKISLRGEEWKEADFSKYDSILHMVGKAHADVAGASKAMQEEYYRVNRDLAVEVAKKAKDQGVKQFVYMSSVILYGESAPVGKSRMITKDTPVSPANFYGDSKKQAEEKLQELNSDNFKIAFVRPPMIYGKDSKGNYRLLSKLATKTCIFPKVKNERSMLYIENLNEFLRLLCESGEGGIYWPQNKEYVNTSQMVKLIAGSKGRNMHLWGWLSPFVWLASKVPGKIGGLVNKAFGSLTIDQSLSTQTIDGYQLYSLEESIKRIRELEQGENYENQRDHSLLSK